MTNFKDLGLSAATLKTLEKKGFEEPTPIQAKAIPFMLNDHRDMIGQAQTGTGKTAAFGLPIIEMIAAGQNHTQALVLAPTRELAVQVAEEINSLKGTKKLNVVAIYGGQSIHLQLKSLRRGADIVVGTPGRVIDHLKRKTLKIDKISYLVLDEADEMLNMGFQEEVSEILQSTNPDKRTMLFSATMPREILAMAHKYMSDYEIIKVTKERLTANKTDQIYFEVNQADKFEALCRIIDIEDDFYGIVFCRTKVDVDKVAKHLIDRGYDADGLHGDITQNLREKILGKFKEHHITVLVATDVAARGIDVRGISHVINYSLPQDSESYVHRIGRTARAGQEGNAITFVTSSEYRKLQVIKRVTKADIRKEKLPKVSDIIANKKLRIKTRLNDIITLNIEDSYVDMAKDLLKQNDSDMMLGALLQYTFKGELDEDKYPEINDAVVQMKGTTRLFVTQGRSAGLNPKSLKLILQNKCNVSADKIRDIKILDNFSFITLPFHEAEDVLDYFKKKNRKKGVYITKAKDKRR